MGSKIGINFELKEGGKVGYGDDLRYKIEIKPIKPIKE